MRSKVLWLSFALAGFHIRAIEIHGNVTEFIAVFQTKWKNRIWSCSTDDIVTGLFEFSVLCVICEVAKKTRCLLVNVQTWKSRGLHSILNSVRKYWWIHEQITYTKMLLWCTCSKQQRSKMPTNVSVLICVLIWNICSSDGNILQCCPFSAVFLSFLFQAEMLRAQSSGQWMHHNSTAPIHKDGCSPLPTVYHIVLWSLSACYFPKAQ